MFRTLESALMHLKRLFETLRLRHSSNNYLERDIIRNCTILGFYQYKWIFNFLSE